MKCFCLPYNGDTEFILGYCRRNADFIHEVYGAEGTFATGRLTHHVDEQELISLISMLKKLDIKFNYLLNSISIKSYITQQERLLKHLNSLKEVGLSELTVSHPHMVKVLSEMGFKVSTSLVQNVRTIEDKNWAEFFGYSRIICSDDLNRRFSELKNLITNSHLPIEIIVNNMCLPSCPLRHSHYELEAYGGECGWNTELKKAKKQVVLCRSLWRNNPEAFLKSSWIRPEDIGRYLDIGVKYIKIAGRDRCSESLRKTFDYYISGECTGSVFDYLLPGVDPLNKYGLPYIDNKKLGEFFNHVLSLSGGCPADCDNCIYCKTFINKII